MKLYVGNLSWNTTAESLREAFEQFGAISDASVITDRETGRSRGFGFVTFEQANDAHTAIEQMDGQHLDGRDLKVNEAKERQRDDSGRRGRSGW